MALVYAYTEALYYENNTGFTRSTNWGGYEADQGKNKDGRYQNCFVEFDRKRKDQRFKEVLWKS